MSPLPGNLTEPSDLNNQSDYNDFIDAMVREFASDLVYDVLGVELDNVDEIAPSERYIGHDTLYDASLEWVSAFDYEPIAKKVYDLCIHDVPDTTYHDAYETPWQWASDLAQDCVRNDLFHETKEFLERNDVEVHV